MIRPSRLLLLLLASLFLPTQVAEAHDVGQSYVFLRVYDTALEGRLEISTKELSEVLGLPFVEGTPITPEQLEQYIGQIRAYAVERFGLAAGGVPYPIRYTTHSVLDLGVFRYIVLDFDVEDLESVPEEIEVRFDILVDTLDDHTGLLTLEQHWRGGIFGNEEVPSLFFKQGDATQTLVLGEGSVMRGFIEIVKQGVWHIWIGIDHILFLVALLLPAVVRRREGVWVPVESFKESLWYTVKIISLFTVAHSITLSLAALDVISLPSRLVESIIAGSIALAAIHNLKALFEGRDWLIAFGFGLFHGFGFATVLGHLGLGRERMVASLFGFNVGVELGQVAIICALFPILFLLRRSRAYPKILRIGSIILIVIALFWLVERVFDLPLTDHVMWYWGEAMSRLTGA